MSEQWRQIAGEPGYEISDAGRLRCWLPCNRLAKAPTEPRIQKPGNRRGYLSYRLYGRKPLSAHRAVLEAFVGPCPEGMEACHGNGIRTDNGLSNLRWDTKLANAADREAHGKTPRGESHARSVLTEPQVMAVWMCRQAGLSQKAIADALCIALHNVKAILQGNVWRHVKEWVVT
jgi:hypothetical protein